MAAAGTIEATDGIHHGGLAGTARAHDGHEFPGKDLQRDPAYGMHLQRAIPVRSLEIDQLDNRFHVQGKAAISTPARSSERVSQWTPRGRRNGRDCAADDLVVL